MLFPTINKNYILVLFFYIEYTIEGAQSSAKSTTVAITHITYLQDKQTGNNILMFRFYVRKPYS